ncbi:MAG: phosphoadenylyl-sulfate reductase [Pseudomonadota bacterium]
MTCLDPKSLRSLDFRVAELNRSHEHLGATEILQVALRDTGPVALVSSFGAESVVLLHMLSVEDRTRPVLFIDTEMLFPETLAYQQEVSGRLGLQDIRVIRSTETPAADPDGTLHLRDPDACCALRKKRPLETALNGFDAWITGRKRYQSGARAELDYFEPEAGTGRIKINPLAHWGPEDVRTYMAENDLQPHPLVAQGYPSIGCLPCTSPVALGEDIRAGRWRNQQKDECGIHFADGQIVPSGARQ